MEHDYWTHAALSFGVDRMTAMLNEVVKAADAAPAPRNNTEALRAANLHKLRRGLEAQIALAEPLARDERTALARAAASLDDPYASPPQRRSVACDDAPVTVSWEDAT